MIRLAEPQWLAALLLLPVLALAAWASFARRRRALGRFAGGAAFAGRFSGEVSLNRRAVKALLLGTGLCASIVALARPQWGTRMEPVTRRGADVVIVLDTSLSMATEDLAPSRLARAKGAIDSLLERIGGDRVALVVFSGRAEVLCPLTLDHAALRLFLDAVHTDEVPVPGSSLAAALTVALRTLEAGQSSGAERGRSIVLLSDGEDHEGGLEQVVPELVSGQLAVFALGTGTAEGGPIPLRDERGEVAGYKKDREGRVVTSRLDENVLERLALDSGGRYWRLTAAQREIEEIAEALAGLEAGELGVELRARYEERFQIPLVLGGLALLAEALVGDRRRRPRAATSENAEVA